MGKCLSSEPVGTGTGSDRERQPNGAKMTREWQLNGGKSYYMLRSLCYLVVVLLNGTEEAERALKGR